jgi:hypothetical protein
MTSTSSIRRRQESLHAGRAEGLPLCATALTPSPSDHARTSSSTYTICADARGEKQHDPSSEVQDPQRVNA